MAVHTPVTDIEISRHLANHYQLGELHYAVPIAEGIENTNYRIDLQLGGKLTSYILTLFERRTNPLDLPYFMALKRHLAHHAIPCPDAMLTVRGEDVIVLADRPSTILRFLPGKQVSNPNLVQVHSLGSALADMHLAAQSFQLSRSSPLAPDKLCTYFDALNPETSDATVMRADLNALTQLDLRLLPTGQIHADLFTDNVLFRGDEVSGLIDFYFANSDSLLTDLAVTLNDWCFNEDGKWRSEHAQQFLRAYHRIRPITSEELRLLPLFLRVMALRFYLTRYEDWQRPDTDGAVLVKKDPAEYAAKWRYHRQHVEWENYDISI